MMKSATLVWILLAVAVAGALFRVSYRVQHLEKHLVSVNKQIGEEEESIRVLQAEWSYLNAPARLETLTRKHLALTPTTASRIVSLDQVPTKSVIPQTANKSDHKATPSPAPASPSNAMILATMKRGPVDD